MAKKARPKGSKKQQFKFKKGDKVMKVGGDGACLTVESVWRREEKVISWPGYFTYSFNVSCDKEVAVAIVGENKIYKEDELLEYSDGLADLMDRVSELEGKKWWKRF